MYLSSITKFFTYVIISKECDYLQFIFPVFINFIHFSQFIILTEVYYSGDGNFVHLSL